VPRLGRGLSACGFSSTPTKSFQLDAVEAVTELFAGQPQGAPEYAVIKIGDIGGLFAGQDRTELGVGNRLLLAEDKLAANARGVQTRQRLPEAVRVEVA
jgi:type III restriction enzyme